MEKFHSHHRMLTILETSDLHGHVLPIHYANNQPYEVGIAKIATLIKQEREKNPYTILIDNGDLIQGTPLTYYHARIESKPIHPMIKILNHLKYEAAVFGNHEFNYGQEVLTKAIHESRFPWMSANIVKKGSDVPFYGKPYLIKQFPNGLKVGILGLITQYIPNWENPNHIQEIDFLDPVETAKKYVPFLRQKEKVDLVVVSYHGGFERDIEAGEVTEQLTGENQGYQLCKEVKGIDVLLTGHQHRSITGHSIYGVVVVQPGHQGRSLAKITIGLEQVEGRWIVKGKSSELLPVEHVSPDPEIVEMVQPYETKTQIWLDRPIGKIQGDMVVHDPLQIRLMDNPLIEFINKVQMEYAKVDISNTALFDNDSPGLKQDVTMRDIVSNYIYPNTLRVIRITGQDMKDALERSASYFSLNTKGEITVNHEFTNPKLQHYNYDMWEGIEYRTNISRPHGERVVMLQYKGKPVEMDGSYDVVMNNYRAGGGGNYMMFRGKEVVRDIPTDVSELIANYILERGTIEATCDHNWEVIQE